MRQRASQVNLRGRSGDVVAPVMLINWIFLINVCLEKPVMLITLPVLISVVDSAMNGIYSLSMLLTSLASGSWPVSGHVR